MIPERIHPLHAYKLWRELHIWQMRCQWAQEDLWYLPVLIKALSVGPDQEFSWISLEQIWRDLLGLADDIPKSSSVLWGRNRRRASSDLHRLFVQYCDIVDCLTGHFGASELAHQYRLFSSNNEASP